MPGKRSPVNEQQFEELTLRDYWRVIVRRRWLIVLGVVVTVVGAMGMVAVQTPIYEAEAQMLVRALPGDVVFSNQNQTGSNAERFIQTEIQVLESELVATRVRDNLGLEVEVPGVKYAACADAGSSATAGAGTRIFAARPAA